MTDASTGAQPQRKALWIPALFVGMMLLVVAVNGTMMFFAESTFSGLDTDKAYQEGIEYNAILKDAAASAALGWTAKTEITKVTAGRHIAVTITDKAGQPVESLRVNGHLVRPVSTAFDQALTLRQEGAGIYGTDVTLPANGSWELRLEATGGATDWQIVQRVFVK
jgi:nitrogen fixation protein FixH